jgi:hypothetical protein
MRDEDAHGHVIDDCQRLFRNYMCSSPVTFVFLSLIFDKVTLSLANIVAFTHFQQLAFDVCTYVCT